MLLYDVCVCGDKEELQEVTKGISSQVRFNINVLKAFTHMIWRVKRELVSLFMT